MAALDLTDDNEKQLVTSIFKGAIECLSQDDQRLPQVNNLLPMLKRGIGLHHSGLLPIMKEVIEIMFQEGLLKVLFATGTVGGRVLEGQRRKALTFPYSGPALQPLFACFHPYRDLLYWPQHACQDGGLH